MTEIERLEELKKYSKLSFNGLAKLLNLKYPQIFYDINAGKCGISKELIFKLKDKFPEINDAWLLTGEGDMLRTSAESSAVVNSCSSELSLHDRLLRIIESQQRTIEELIRERNSK